MRADRLVSIVLLLRKGGRLTADTLAQELEVSTRTVLRDIEALSAAGVPVYAERGRHGGYELLPGFRTELTGLNHDEALALLTAGSGRGEKVFGLSVALASARRKVVDALPESHRVTASDAAERLLIEPETDLLSRRLVTEEVPDRTMIEVRRAVLTAEELTESAERPDRVDLDSIWRERGERFLSEGHITVLVRVAAARREELLSTAVAVRAEDSDTSDWLRLELTFQDLWHAEWALWQLGMDAEALSPPPLRAALRDRAVMMATRYAGPR